MEILGCQAGMLALSPRCLVARATGYTQVELEAFIPYVEGDRLRQSELAGQSIELMCDFIASRQCSSADLAAQLFHSGREVMLQVCRRR